VRHTAGAWGAACAGVLAELFSDAHQAGQRDLPAPAWADAFR